VRAPPPYLVRRFLIGPIFVVLPLIGAAALPLWFIGAAFASRYVPGRWRPLRVAWFLFVYLALEALMLVILFGLWIGSGFGWRLRTPSLRSAHYRLAGWWLRRVMGSARRTLDLNVQSENTIEDRRARPLLVFSRHAGPGDSFLLIDGLLNRAEHRPRVVLKDLLRLDPCVDVLLSRLPNRFIPSHGRAGDAVVASIAELAATMDQRDALVIFPEGGNFTPSRRERSIEKLEEIGRPGLAEQAREMRHVLPPKPTGALNAIDAARGADVVFVGHVGLEQLSSVRDLWRGIPMDSQVLSRLWVVPAEDVPPAEAREQWLYDHWRIMDEWIDEHVVAASIGDRSGGSR
jgi:1-acyl-sn-glycerol-3-phosphate acyltransferase